MKSNIIYRKKNNNFVAKHHIWSLIIAAIIGFFVTLSILIASNIIAYNIATQTIQNNNAVDVLGSLNMIIKRFVNTPELVIASLGGILTLSFRYMFYFGKIYSY